jgi:hypothetical protein
MLDMWIINGGKIQLRSGMPNPWNNILHTYLEGGLAVAGSPHSEVEWAHCIVQWNPILIQCWLFGGDHILFLNFILFYFPSGYDQERKAHPSSPLRDIEKAPPKKIIF